MLATGPLPIWLLANWGHSIDVKRGAAHAVLATQLRNRCAGLGLFEDAEDLAVGISGLFHAESPSFTLRENSTSEHRYFSGGLPI